MLDRDTRRTLEASPVSGGDEESWLTSYLDVLTLLITLFVLLLALSPPGGEDRDAQRRHIASAVPALSLASLTTGIKPRHRGLSPAFAGLSIPGVDVSQGREGVTLRIDDSLLFSSGRAQLTDQGRGVVASLVDVLGTFDGQISIEGHTDNIPIATVRFPSNWELSSARAIAVLRYLKAQGLAVTRMRAVGYADTQPMQNNATPDGRAVNRRVELVLRKPSEPSSATAGL
jgi:chemotaxis protein MotB